jgi:hypothetical protein
VAASYTIRHSPEFSQLVATLSEQAHAELATVYRALARGPLPGQSLLAIEPVLGGAEHLHPAVRGGLLIYVVPSGKRLVGMVDMVGVQP